MAWIESHQTLREHPKVYRIMEQLNVSKPQALGHLHLLWWWCVDYAPTGKLDGFTDLQLARAAEWGGEPKLFVNALLDAKLLDRDHGVCSVHDWLDTCGELMKKRLDRASAKRRTLSAVRQKLSRKRLPTEPTEPNLPNRTEPKTPSGSSPAIHAFAIPASVLTALDRAAILGAVPRLRTPAVWQAFVRAYPEIDHAAELLKAESWLAANPRRAPKKDLVRFLRNWLERAAEQGRED